MSASRELDFSLPYSLNGKQHVTTKIGSSFAGLLNADFG